MDDQRTVLARPLPLSTTEERVKDLFSQQVGRVKKVKLRRDENNQAFRGSVYVEFENQADAQTAVSRPPLRPGSKTEYLEVILKSDYNQQKQQAHARQASKPHKRPRHESDAQQQQLPPPPPAPQRRDLDIEQELLAYASGNVAATGGYPPLQQQREARSQDARHAASLASMQHRAEEAEQALAAQRDENSAMLHRLLTAQASAEEAQSREAATSRKLLAKEAEIGSLKGEVLAAKSSAATRYESSQAQFKGRVHDLEVQVHKLRDDNNMLRRERDLGEQRMRSLERKLKALQAGGSAAAAAAAAGGGGAEGENQANGRGSKPPAGQGSEDEL